MQITKIIFVSFLVGGLCAPRDASAYPVYLNTAGAAWESVLNTFGVSGAVAQAVNDVKLTNQTQYNDFISVLAFNSATMTIMQGLQHVDMSLSEILTPLSGRRKNGNLLNFDGKMFATFAEFDSDKNSNFKTRNSGVTISAGGFVSSGLALGINFTQTKTDTRKTMINADATANSFTLFSKYLGTSGAFVNMALGAGQVNWSSDKAISGIIDSAVYDTNFLSGQINSGVQVNRRWMSIVPQLAVRYVRLETDKHIDDAVQEFQRWWYNTLTTMADVKFVADFQLWGYSVHPSFRVGMGYDVVSNGTDAIGVHLISGDYYNIPINSPHRTSLRGGIELGIVMGDFSMGLGYGLDMRSDYVAHTGTLNVNIVF